MRGRKAVNEDERKVYQVHGVIFEKEWEALDSIAKEWDMPPGMILYRLIKLFIAERWSFVEILRKVKDIRHVGSMRVSTTLSRGEMEGFLAITDDWDLPPGVVARGLLRFFLQHPDKTFIWEMKEGQSKK